MATGSQQLVDDYEQLKNALELYPSVQIVNVEGQPPDNYDILYNLRGYTKNADDVVEIDTSHRVRISLPFGYPHFAPTAKPLTSIFHPDIDPDAIRIAGRWQENPSLPDLVLYIGEMISGSVYNLEDPFNQEAAEWYASHAHELPLDSLSIADIVEPNSPIDDLVDDTFASLGLENDDFLAGPSTREEEETAVPRLALDKSRIEEIEQLIAARQIFTANSILQEASESYDIPNLESMQQAIGKALRKTDQLFKLAEQLEDMGKPEEALEVVDNLLEVAADAPGALEIRNRIQESSSFSREFNLEKAQETATPPDTAARKAPRPEHDTKEEPPPPPHRTPRSPSLPRFDIPFKLILTAVTVLGIAIGGMSLYFKDQNILSKAQADFLKSQLQAEKRDFEGALELAEEALDSLDGLTILRFSKGRIENSIREMIDSKQFQEGLAGRVLYNDEYIPIATANALKELSVLTDQARSLKEQKKIREALTIYQQALLFSQEHDLEGPLVEIQAAIGSLRYSEALTMAEKAELEKNWQDAAQTYRKALELSAGVGAKTADVNTITDKLTAATFRQEVDESIRAFTEAQWQETINKLERAQQLIKENPGVVSQKELEDLDRLLVHSRLYQMLGNARQAYEQQNWNGSIRNYEQSLRLLAAESAIFQEDVQSSRAKIEKTLLLVRIAQVQDDVLLARQAGDPKKIVPHLEKILSLITSSAYANEPDVKSVADRVRNDIRELQQELYVAEKIAYLENRFEEIFRANYPTFRGSKLTKPKIELLREVDQKMIFHMTCVERNQGSASRLELNYQYDKATGQWSVHEEQ